MNLTDVANSKVWVYPNTPGPLLARFLGVPSEAEGDREEGESGQESSSTETLSRAPQPPYPTSLTRQPAPCRGSSSLLFSLLKPCLSRGLLDAPLKLHPGEISWHQGTVSLQWV